MVMEKQREDGEWNGFCNADMLIKIHVFAT